MITTDEIRAMLLDVENDRVERTISTTNTDKQFALATHLVDELKSLGLTEVEMDSMGYVYATLPAHRLLPCRCSF